MYRKVAASGLQQGVAARGRAVEAPPRRTPAHGESERWPRGIALTVALMVSLAMWAGLISAVLTVISR